MTIVIGRGNSRKCYEVPCADIINRGNTADQKTLTNNVFRLLNIR